MAASRSAQNNGQMDSLFWGCHNGGIGLPVLWASSTAPPTTWLSPAMSTKKKQVHYCLRLRTVPDRAKYWVQRCKRSAHYVVDEGALEHASTGLRFCALRLHNRAARHGRGCFGCKCKSKPWALSSRGLPPSARRLEASRLDRKPHMLFDC